MIEANSGVIAEHSGTRRQQHKRSGFQCCLQSTVTAAEVVEIAPICAKTTCHASIRPYFVVSTSHHTERYRNRSDDSGRFLLFTCAESCIDRAEATNSCTVRKLRASSRLCADVVCHGGSGAVYGRQQWLWSLHFIGTWIVPLQQSCNSRDAPTQYRKFI